MKPLEMIRIFIKAQLMKLSVRLFNVMFRHEITGMRAIVENGVNQRTIAAIMSWLDFKRVMHCQFCPNTESLHAHKPEVNGPTVYVCDRHQAMAEKMVAERAAVVAAKKKIDLKVSA